ncbi:MAG: hypothetical protein ACO22U_16750 [bacterium]|jgi:hypothetical protein
MSEFDEKILKVVSDEFGLNPSQIVGIKRYDEFVEGRVAVFNLMVRELGVGRGNALRVLNRTRGLDTHYFNAFDQHKQKLGFRYRYKNCIKRLTKELNEG